MKAKAGALLAGALCVLVIGFGVRKAFLSFIRFGAVSKQIEAKRTLRDLLTAQRAFFAEQNRWASSFEELAWGKRDWNRYRFALARDGEVLLPGSPDGGAHTIVAVDKRYAPRDPDAAHPPAIPLAVWESLGAKDGALTMVATGNIDVDLTLDVWSIASAERFIEGERVEAGVPYCHVDDSLK